MDVSSSELGSQTCSVWGRNLPLPHRVAGSAPAHAASGRVEGGLASGDFEHGVVEGEFENLHAEVDGVTGEITCRPAPVAVLDEEARKV